MPSFIALLVALQTSRQQNFPDSAFARRLLMKDPSDRRTFLQFLALGAITSALPNSALAQEENVRKKTYTYKTVEKCEIKADVYGASDRTRPVVMWIHGGALIMGSRGSMDKALLGKLLKAGYAVVSIDYRLAPET